MLKFALVGCGAMANWHAQQLKLITDVEVVALVDICPPNVAVFGEKYFPEARHFESYQAMLDQLQSELDAVVLVTPHALHYPQIKAALERGINVLSEKPMVTASEHAVEICRLAQRSGKQLGIAFQAPYTSEFMYLARERDAGRLGVVQLISGHISQGWLNVTRGKWRQDPIISGGGMLYDTGAHLFNAILWLMNQPIIEVGCFYDRAGADVDINGVAILKFEGGALATVAIGGNCPSWQTEIQIQTDRMLITTASHGGKLEMFINNRRLYPHVQMHEHAAAHSPHANFVNALRGSEEVLVPARYGLLLTTLMDALYESAHEGRMVRVKPVDVAII